MSEGGRERDSSATVTAAAELPSAAESVAWLPQ